MRQIMAYMCTVHDGVCIELDYVRRFSLSCDTIAHPTDVSKVVPHPHTPILYFPPLYDACLPPGSAFVEVW